MKPHVAVSVGSMVDLFLRSGDLEFGFSGPQRALEGIRTHQMLRKSRPDGYLAEQAVRLEIERRDFILEVSGRLDGVFASGSTPVVEEIKSTYHDPEQLLRSPDPRHWGQVRCYAYMWACRHGLKELEVRLTYWHLPTSSSHVFSRTLKIGELEEFFFHLLDRYCAWLRQQVRWQIKRNTSIVAMDFPFDDFRAGQREMAVAVFRTVREAGRIMIEAPTGIGKTMAVLFAAIKAMAEGATAKIFFLTARTTGRMAAEKALELLRRRGLALRSLSLTAKDKLCLQPGSECLPDQCPYAAGYYDRLAGALDTAWQLQALDRKALEDLAASHRLCPFALSMELVQTADCVICDYNYIFDPQVALRWLSADGAAADFTLLVDEAHNLVERSRQMYSAAVFKIPLLELRRVLKTDQPAIYRALSRINAWMARARSLCVQQGGSQADETVPWPLVERLIRFCRLAEDWLVLKRQADHRRFLQELYFAAAAFVRTAQLFDASYRTVYQTDGEELEVKLFCLDAAGQLSRIWGAYRAAVLFSATIIPLEYFRRLLGLAAQVPAMRLASPFPPENFRLLVARHIPTYYHRRGASCPQIVSLVKTLIETRPGNYLVFFPSYQYLELVAGQLEQAGLDAEILKQKPSMGALEKQRFLSHFDENRNRSLLALAVVGGVFGEGIDLEGQRLTGAVIIGVGLPAVCRERELIKAHHQSRGEPGFDYAYRYPGLVRILQAAGRVIRSETDRGLVLLIDQRYSTPKYREVLEHRWQPVWIASSAGLEAALADFDAGKAVAPPWPGGGDVASFQQPLIPGPSSRQ